MNALIDPLFYLTSDITPPIVDIDVNVRLDVAPLVVDPPDNANVEVSPLAASYIDRRIHFMTEENLVRGEVKKLGFIVVITKSDHW